MNIKVMKIEKHKCVCVCKRNGKPEEHLENRQGTLEGFYAQLQPKGMS